MYEINPRKQVELLRWLMATMEGHWLVKTSAALGPGEALKLSGKVHSAFGKTEMKAVLALVGKNKAESLADAADLLRTYLELVYGEKGWQGTFRQVSGESSGIARMEIEVARCAPLDNIKRATAGAHDGLSLACELVWSSWLETLLPDQHIEVTTQLAGTNGRTVDCYTISSFSDSFMEESPPILDTATSSPVAAALQIPLEENPPPAIEAPPIIPSAPVDYTSYIPPVQRAVTPPTQPTPYAPTTASEPVTPPPTPPQGRTLAERIASKRGVSPEATPAPEKFAGDVPVLPSVRIDTRSGQPLFSQSTDKEVKDSLDRRDRKRNNLVQKMFISKEGRKMMENGIDAPLVPQFSLAMGIENVLQELIGLENQQQPGTITEQVHVIGGPDGDLQIQVGTRVYHAISDVPNGRIKELLQEAVQRWGDR